MSVLDLILLISGTDASPRRTLPETLIHRNRFTDFLQDLSNYLLHNLDVLHNSKLSIIVYTILVALISFVAGFIFRWIVLHTTYYIGDKFDAVVFKELRQFKFFSRVSYLIPEFVFFILIRFSYVSGDHLAVVLSGIAILLILITIGMSVNAFLDALWFHLDSRDNKRKLPLKGLVQLMKGIVWIVVAILCVGFVFDKSPLTLLGGLGAFAAVLMLVFKDSILGVVASVQLSEYNTLHIGDWIKVPGTDANGTVVETNLIAIKVQNWDKTTTMVPPYSLVSGSFTNYTSMWQSETRRIYRTVMIDAQTIRRADDELLSQISTLPFMADYISKKKKLAEEGKDSVRSADGLVAGSIETNLGLLRAYLKMYLDASDNFDHSPASLAMVYSDQQTEYGVPLSIYCFTATSKWAEYESIQSALFEHLMIVMPVFGLAVFEGVSSRSALINGSLRSGADPSSFFGMPTPYMRETPAPSPEKQAPSAN